MASSRNSLEENLKCSICLEIFMDPVLLSCSHSFCKACLGRTWNKKDAKECPICRQKIKGTSTFSNRALRGICESYMEEKKRKISEEHRGVICLDHAEKHQLFCKDDKQLVCMQCVSQDHHNHSFSTISSVAREYKTKLQGPLQKLQNKLQDLNKTQMTFNQSSTKRTQEIEKQIRDEFETLHQFLRDELATRITALKEEEKEKKKQKNKKFEEVRSEISKRIKKTEEEMNGDESLFVFNFKDIEERTKFKEPDLELDSEASIDIAEHVGNLKFRVWEKMKNLCPFYPIIMVPEGRRYQLCKDLISVRLGPRSIQPSPVKNNQPILGSEGFFSGVHSWTVEVGALEQWAFGLSMESANGGLAPFSLIRLGKGKHSWDSPAPTFTKVRVTLNCEKHEVVYTDPDTNTVLQTHTSVVPGIMFPCFYSYSQIPLKILPAKVSVAVSSI